MRFIAKEISRDTYVNVMDQYRPAGESRSAEGLDRRPTPEELRRAAEAARRAGLRRGIFPLSD